VALARGVDALDGEAAGEHGFNVNQGPRRAEFRRSCGNPGLLRTPSSINMVDRKSRADLRCRTK
jgi:hypothetical protein